MLVRRRYIRLDISPKGIEKFQQEISCNRKALEIKLARQNYYRDSISSCCSLDNAGNALPNAAIDSISSAAIIYAYKAKLLIA